MGQNPRALLSYPLTFIVLIIRRRRALLSVRLYDMDQQIRLRINWPWLQANNMSVKSGNPILQITNQMLQCSKVSKNTSKSFVCTYWGRKKYTKQILKIIFMMSYMARVMKLFLFRMNKQPFIKQTLFTQSKY
jgi:hypothetical protein